MPVVTVPAPPQYQVKVLADDYGLSAWLEAWLKIKYRIALNELTSASLDLAANDDKISLCEMMSRLHIIRDGTTVWAGFFEVNGWSVETRGEGGTIDTPFALDARDYSTYLLWRTVAPAAGQDFDTRTDHLDDIAKDWVYDHCGAGAAAARQFSDLTVQADAHACTSTTKSAVGKDVLTWVGDLAKEGAFWWRMVPSSSGVQFRTKAPLWGVDRTKGNGSNDELVFAFDRRNTRRMDYKIDLTAHRNYAYMRGAGEGQDQVAAEVEDATARAAYKRREVWVTASQYTTEAELQAEALRVLDQHKAYEVMAAHPLTGIVTPSNLGDKCTVFERRYGRSFEFTAVITALDVEVDRYGNETITPSELVAA